MPTFGSDGPAAAEDDFFNRPITPPLTVRRRTVSRRHHPDERENGPDASIQFRQERNSPPDPAPTSRPVKQSSDGLLGVICSLYVLVIRLGSTVSH